MLCCRMRFCECYHRESPQQSTRQFHISVRPTSTCSNELPAKLKKWSATLTSLYRIHFPSILVPSNRHLLLLRPHFFSFQLFASPLSSHGLYSSLLLYPPMRNFYTFIRTALFFTLTALFFTLTNVGPHNPPSLRAQHSRWKHRSVSDSDTICNRSSPLLGDIVYLTHLFITPKTLLLTNTHNLVSLQPTIRTPPPVFLTSGH